VKVKGPTAHRALNNQKIMEKKSYIEGSSMESSIKRARLATCCQQHHTEELRLKRIFLAAQSEQHKRKRYYTLNSHSQQQKKGT
jgi:hypothetical protein